jgi:superfamily II DNA/RNA helicase
MTFDLLGLSDGVLRAVTDAGYETPTPIQEQAIPYVLMGRDILGCAQTGTGKTASFTLPMIDILSQGRARARMPRSLILTPTRELAAQISENFTVYGKYSKLSMALLIGGESFGPQVAKLDRGVDVLIATPGRLIDHFERGRILLTDVKILVIDEADRMLDMGFIPDVERIASFLPKIKQTLFFSATFPKEVKRLADKFLMNPKEITISPKTSAAETVEHFLIPAPGKDTGKQAALRDLLKKEAVKNALIFCNRKRDVDAVAKSLKSNGFSACPLHGDMAQASRTETLENFKAGKVTYMVATDVAGRGIDIAGLSHVFNYDVPYHAEDYIHRIGRTGRAGAKGRAVMLVTGEDKKYIDAIQKLIGKQIPQYRQEGTTPAVAAESSPDTTPAPETDAKAEPAQTAAKPEADPEGQAKRRRPRRGRSRNTSGASNGAQTNTGTSNGGQTNTDASSNRVQNQPVTTSSAAQSTSKDTKPEARTEPARPSRSQNPKPAPKADNARPQNAGSQQTVGLGEHMPAFLARGSDKK